MSAANLAVILPDITGKKLKKAKGADGGGEATPTARPHTCDISQAASKRSQSFSTAV